MDDDSKLALQLLAEQIKKRRKTLGLSQEKLAEKCGFDRTYISLLERSERNPSYLLSIRVIIASKNTHCHFYLC